MDKHAATNRGVHLPRFLDFTAWEFFSVTGKALSCGAINFVEACGKSVTAGNKSLDARVLATRPHQRSGCFCEKGAFLVRQSEDFIYLRVCSHVIPAEHMGPRCQTKRVRHGAA